MKQQSKLNSQEQQEAQQQAGAEQTQKPSAQEFATPEELLRHDALHTFVPPTVARRLAESIGKTPPRPRSWWQRLFGGSGR
jgi:hypothetical protein